MPFGHEQPLSLFIGTIASSGDRKSGADKEALWPVRKREKDLYDDVMELWHIDHGTWVAEKKKIEGDNKLSREEKKTRLANLGPEPQKPLEPIFIDQSPTIEGLVKNWANLPATLGLFSTEALVFIVGFGMNDDNRGKTAGWLSSLWDGEVAKRIRASDIAIHPGPRRVFRRCES